MKKLIILLFAIQSSFLFSQVPTIERDALIALYNATDGPNWTFNGLWLSADPVANWFGVDVENISGQDHVTNLALSSNNLNGILISDIENLSFLKGLYLGYNQISGNIPIELCNLEYLETISLEVCQLSGGIPVEIGNLENLIDLTLSVNNLSGNIPHEIGNLTNLNLLDLRNNHFSGIIPFELENMFSLEGIGLSYNELSGEIDLSDLNNLEVLFINNNDISNINIKNGNNTNFTWFNVTNNPHLTCVIVDDANWSESNWPDKDPETHYFETQAACDEYLEVTTLQSDNLLVYPNPTKDKVSININDDTINNHIQVYNMLGEKLMQFQNTKIIDLSKLEKGIYLIEIKDREQHQSIVKVIKE